MTGRAAGYCAGQDMPGHASAGGGRGRGWGRGMPGGGRGWRHRLSVVGWRGWWRRGCGPWAATAPMDAPTVAADERRALQAHVASLQAELERVQQRLRELPNDVSGA